MRAVSLFLLAAMACTSDDPQANSAALAQAPAGAFETTAAAMRPGSAEAIASATVAPLLLPSPYAEATLAMAGPTWFALAYRDPEHSVSLHATRLVHGQVNGPASPRPLDVRSHPAATTVNEGIRALTWEEAGTHYALEVECRSPFGDERCTAPGYALDLANDLLGRVGAQQ